MRAGARKDEFEIEGLVIRNWRERDRPRLTELLFGLIRFEHVIANDRRLDCKSAEDGVREMLKNVREQDGRLIVAEIHGRLEGFLALTYGRLGPHVIKDQREFAYVSDMYVSEPWRRHGVGAALMLEAEATARVKGLKRMIIGALIGNDLAVDAYKKYGFRPYAVELTREID